MRLQPSARIEPPLPAPIRAAVSREVRKPRRTPSSTIPSRCADARRLLHEGQSLDKLPAALAADPAVLARVAPDLRDAVGGCVRVDAAAALDELLLDRDSLGRDENLVLALRAEHRQGHVDLGQ